MNAKFTYKTTTEERFNSAVDALRAEGIEVVLNCKGGMAYEAFDKIAWTSDMPTIVFNKEGEPMLGRDDEVTGRGEGEYANKVIMHHIGQGGEVQDAIVKHFTDAGFPVVPSGSFYTGVTIRFDRVVRA